MPSCNFFHTWCLGVNMCWCNKKINIFFYVGCLSINMCWCNKFFFLSSGPRRIMSVPNFFSSVECECQHVDVTNYFFYFFCQVVRTKTCRRTNSFSCWMSECQCDNYFYFFLSNGPHKNMLVCNFFFSSVVFMCQHALVQQNKFYFLFFSC